MKVPDRPTSTGRERGDRTGLGVAPSSLDYVRNSSLGGVDPLS